MPSSDTNANSELMRRLAEMDAASDRFDASLQSLRPNDVTPELFADILAEHDTWACERRRAAVILRGMASVIQSKAAPVALSNGVATKRLLCACGTGALAGLAAGLWLAKLL